MVTVSSTTLVDPCGPIPRCGISVYTGGRRRTIAPIGSVIRTLRGPGCRTGLSQFCCRAGRILRKHGGLNRMGNHAGGPGKHSNVHSNTIVFGRIRRCRGCSGVGIFVANRNGITRPHINFFASGNSMSSNPLSSCLTHNQHVLFRNRPSRNFLPFVYYLGGGSRIRSRGG